MRGLPPRRQRRPGLCRQRWVVYGSLLLLTRLGIVGVLGQNSGSANDSIEPPSAATTTTTDESYRMCREVWLQSDANQDTVITLTEYINWVINYSPYSPAYATGDCRGDGSGSGQIFVSHFLGSAPLAVAFEALACLCRQYTGNGTCCDGGSPHLELPGTSLFPTSYSATVCQALDRVLAAQCSSSHNATATTNGGGNSTAPAGDGSAPATDNANEDPGDSGNGNSTASIVSDSGSNSSRAGGEEPPPAGEDASSSDAAGGESRRRMLQVVLPLLLVSAAALFMAAAIVMYHRRKRLYDYDTGRSFSPSRRSKASSSDGNGAAGAGDASSTDSDEEAQTGAALGSDDGSSSSGDESSGDATTAGSFLDESGHDAAPAKRGRPAPHRNQHPSHHPKHHRHRASRRSNRHPGRPGGSLPASASQRRRLEPLREGADEEEDDGSTSCTSAAAVAGGEEGLAPPSAPSLREDEDEDDEEEEEEEGGSGRSASTDRSGDEKPSDLEVAPECVQPPQEDVESGIVPPADDSVPERGNAHAIVVEVPPGVIRRTKELDESFDEVSL